MKHFTILLTCVVSALLIGSCTVEKRRYTKGVHLTWAKKKPEAKKSHPGHAPEIAAATVQTLSAFVPVETDEGERVIKNEDPAGETISKSGPGSHDQKSKDAFNNTYSKQNHSHTQQSMAAANQQRAAANTGERLGLIGVVLLVIGIVIFFSNPPLVSLAVGLIVLAGCLIIVGGMISTVIFIREMITEGASGNWWKAFIFFLSLLSLYLTFYL